MKKIIVKILIAVVVIVGIVFVAEKLFIKQDEVIEVANEKAMQEVDKAENVAVEENSVDDEIEVVEMEEEPKAKVSEVEEESYDVLVIGNSLTLERDGIGMAASDQYHDYYYWLQKRLEKKYGKVNINRVSAIDWEENRKISSRTDWLQENLTKELCQDKALIIFQLGDNAVPTEAFEESAEELVNHVKKYSPEAAMLWVAMWFINEERMAMLPQICSDLGMDFVDITDLVVDENKSHIGAEVTAIDGSKDTIATIEEAFHPNDEGMKKIADKICRKLGI